MFSWNALLPPHWKEKYLPLWFEEDFNGLDISSAIIGDHNCRAELLFKSSEVKKKKRVGVDKIITYFSAFLRVYHL